MNNDNRNPNAAARASGRPGMAPYRPNLRFFHPNGKGTGCAVKMALHPAHDLVDGSIMLMAANQMTVGDSRGPNPTFPRFDWENAVCAKLDFADLCKMLQVFRGECDSLEGDRGLYHKSARGSTRIVLRRLREPVPGYSFELYRMPVKGDAVRTHILFTPWEALGIAEAIAGSMSVLSFGIPSVAVRETSVGEAENREYRNANAA